MIQNKDLLEILSSKSVNYFVCIQIKSEYKTLCFTNKDIDINYDNLTFKPGLLIKKLSFRNIHTANVLNQINIMQSTEMIEEIKDFANNNTEILIYLYSKSTQWEILEDIFKGFIFSLENISNNEVKITFYDMLYQLQNEIGEFFSPVCRAEFGDKKCQKNLAEYTSSGLTLNVINQHSFITDILKPDGYFLNGYAIIYDKNSSKKFKSKIINHINNIIYTLSDCNFQLQTNFIIELIQPCNKSIADCKKFNNIVNFRGEGFVK